jgi:valyl-tRNA synthetase
MESLREIVVKIRNLRAEAGIDPGKRIEVVLHPTQPRMDATLRRDAGLIAALARAATVRIEASIAIDAAAARGVVAGCEIALPLAGVLDLDAERTRIGKELARITGEAESRARKLQTASFLERAPAEVVERERALQAELAEKKLRLERTLEALSPGKSAG